MNGNFFCSTYRAAFYYDQKIKTFLQLAYNSALLPAWILIFVSD